MNSKVKQLALKWLAEDDEPVVTRPSIVSPNPALSFEDQLSAICDKLLENPGPIGALDSGVLESPRVPSDPSPVEETLSSDETEGLDAADAAVLDILLEFDQADMHKAEKGGGGGGRDRDGECDDFDESVVFQPKLENIECLRETVRRESAQWQSAHVLEKAKARLSERTPMQVLYDRERNRRGCARGACCVYSMWYDPTYGGHGNCTHRCTVSPGAVARCGPSLFALDLPSLDYPGDFGGNTNRTYSRAQGNFNIACKSNRRLLSQLCKKRHSPEPVALSAHAARHHDSLAIVPTATTESAGAARGGAKRTRKNLSTVSRIRKNLGRRNFGKLERQKEIVHELPYIVAANYCGS